MSNNIRRGSYVKFKIFEWDGPLFGYGRVYSVNGDNLYVVDFNEDFVLINKNDAQKIPVLYYRNSVRKLLMQVNPGGDWWLNGSIPAVDLT